MTLRLLLVLAFAICALVGFTCRDRQYRIEGPFVEADQSVLAHSDSAYTSMTWVASPAGNYFQLRFFDKVEGGICLHPSWRELVALHDPRLAHLVPDPEPEVAEAGPTWSYPWTPDPGTVSNSAYVRLFPLCLLMNNTLVAQAHDDPRAVSARVLVVGLGSSAGIAVLAHHFPNIAITVVDIDHKVVDIVRAHFPLTRWLSEQRRADGEPRLQFHIGDARQYIHHLGESEEMRFDAVILDAYTAGSTIPPHLMTKEFFTDCARVLRPHGIVLANVIGCYGVRDEKGTITGDKHRVLGGAMRTFRAAGLTHLINFPVLKLGETPATITVEDTRNNIIVCSADPLEPQGEADVRWKRLSAFELFPEVPLATYLVREYQLLNSEDFHVGSGVIDASVIDGPEPSIAGSLAPWPNSTPLHRTLFSKDERVIARARAAVLAWAHREHHDQIPTNWGEGSIPLDMLFFSETDSVAYARDTFAGCVVLGHEVRKNGGDALVGDADFADPHRAPDTAIISDAPLFTDQRPNADILNR